MDSLQHEPTWNVLIYCYDPCTVFLFIHSRWTDILVSYINLVMEPLTDIFSPCVWPWKEKTCSLLRGMWVFYFILSFLFFNGLWSIRYAQALCEILRDMLYDDDLAGYHYLPVTHCQIFSNCQTPFLFFPVQYIGSFTSEKAGPSKILRDQSGSLSFQRRAIKPDRTRVLRSNWTSGLWRRHNLPATQQARNIIVLQI